MRRLLIVTVEVLGWLGLTAAVLAVCGWMLAGCAAGRTPSGGVVLGVDVASMPETAAEIASAATGALPFPFNHLGQLAVVALTGYAANKRGRHVGERVGWEEAAATFSPPPPKPPQEPQGGREP